MFSSLVFSSALTVCNSSFMDCSSSLEVSSSSAVERYSSLIDCSSSFAARRSWTEMLCSWRLAVRRSCASFSSSYRRRTSWGSASWSPSPAAATGSISPPSMNKIKACGAAEPSPNAGRICMVTRRLRPLKSTLTGNVSVDSFISRARSSAIFRSRRSSGRTIAGSSAVNGPPECRMKAPADGDRFTMRCASSTRILGVDRRSSAAMWVKATPLSSSRGNCRRRSGSAARGSSIIWGNCGSVREACGRAR